MNKKSLRSLLLIILILVFSGLVMNKIINKKEAPVSIEDIKYENVLEDKEGPQEDVVEKQVVDNIEEFYISAWDDIEESVPVLLYAKQLYKTSDGGRAYPTVQILRKIGNNESEVLAQVGKVGEYPYYHSMSPDNKFLLINLESKLQILDLETKELEDLFIPKKQVASVSYSPDGTEIFIVDQKYGTSDKEYHVYILDLASREYELLKTGEAEDYLFGKIWRDDNVVTMKAARGGYAPMYFFDIANNDLQSLGLNYSIGVASLDGHVMAVRQEDVPNICNEHSGAAISLYYVIDPVSGFPHGSSIGREGYHNEVMAFSPDRKEVMYYSRKPWTDREDCDKEAERKYYIQEIGTSNIEEIDNPTEIKNSWGYDDIGASLQYDYEERSWTILMGEEPLIKSGGNLDIIGQFFE